MSEPKHIIISKDDEELTWSNSEGFTHGDDFEVFSEEEKKAFNLPIGGCWARLITNLSHADTITEDQSHD